MPAHTHSGSSGFTGFLLGIVFTVVVAAGLMLWNTTRREAPLRTVELSLPTPDLPAPPDMLPDAQNAAPAARSE